MRRNPYTWSLQPKLKQEKEGTYRSPKKQGQIRKCTSSLALIELDVQSKTFSCLLGVDIRNFLSNDNWCTKLPTKLY